MMHEDLAALRRAVCVDGELQSRLRELDDQQTFVAAVVELADARGLSVSREQVEAEIAAHRRAWLERWL